MPHVYVISIVVAIASVEALEEAVVAVVAKLAS